MHTSRIRLALTSAFAMALLIAPLAMAFAQAPPLPLPPPRQEGSASLAFVGTTGNSQSQTISAGAEYIARPANWVIKSRFNVVRSSNDSVVATESWLYGTRAERALNARTSAFGEYAFFRDEFAGVEARNGVTGGLMFGVIKSDRQTLGVDAGIGYLNEHRIVGDDVSTGTYSGGAAYKLKLSENAELTDEVRLLGTFYMADDWRASNMVAVTAKLTTMFSLKFSSVVRYMNFPPPGFKTTDTTTSIALVASFKRQ